MLFPGQRRIHPELKQIVQEASRALACLNADRLEELAAACQALNRDLESISSSSASRADLARQVREATGDMAVFSRVLEVTRSNVSVMHRLRELREGRLEYREAVLRPKTLALTESTHGNH